MPIALRQAEVAWDGTPASGAGALSSKASDLCPVSNAPRGNVQITVHDAVDEG